MMGSVTEAEDVVQESYVKAHRALVAGKFDARSRVETWLYRIVVNASLDAKKKRAREKAEPLDVEIAARGSAEEALALRELAAMLEELPEDQRGAILMKADGMASSEIAEVLGCSEGAVEQRLVRGRQTLREKRSP